MLSKLIDLFNDLNQDFGVYQNTKIPLTFSRKYLHSTMRFTFLDRKIIMETCTARAKELTGVLRWNNRLDLIENRL